MYSKCIKFASLLVFGAFVLAGDAYAVNINTGAVVCHAFDASSAQDIRWATTSVFNAGTQPRQVVCSVPRSPLAAGVAPQFFVDGSNNPNSSTTCTFQMYTITGVVSQSLSFTESAGADARAWHHLVSLPATGTSASDYAVVQCTLPANNSSLQGVTSIQ